VTKVPDPYLVLGIARDAPDRVVREAYYARARRAHPDVVGTHGLEAMRLLNEAWAILKDPKRRATYDAAHSGVPARPQPGTTPPKPGWKPAKSQPAWTGAAGRPPGRPSGHVLEFGIYAGWSLGEVARKDRGYLAWLRDRPEGRKYADEINRLLDPRAG
jgi:curved DNA-binding protein CbpA